MFAMVVRGHSWRRFFPTVTYTCHTLIDRISANPLSVLLLDVFPQTKTPVEHWLRFVITYVSNSIRYVQILIWFWFT